MGSLEGSHKSTKAWIIWQNFTASQDFRKNLSGESVLWKLHSVWFQNISILPPHPPWQKVFWFVPRPPTSPENVCFCHPPLPWKCHWPSEREVFRSAWCVIMFWYSVHIKRKAEHHWQILHIACSALDESPETGLGLTLATSCKKEMEMLAGVSSCTTEITGMLNSNLTCLLCSKLKVI